MIDRNYIPGTECTRRRPTATDFVNRREWIEVDEKNIDITNITELTNINNQLEQTVKLYISNVIQRTISQLTAAYGSGFVTLQATEDGQLKVYTSTDEKTILRAKIDIATATDHTIISAVSGKKIHIVSMMFTVAGEVNITLKSNTTALTGAMDFGGDLEPHGMVAYHGIAPLATASGSAFKIGLSDAVQVSGYVTYYTE